MRTAGWSVAIGAPMMMIMAACTQPGAPSTVPVRLNLTSISPNTGFGGLTTVFLRGSGIRTGATVAFGSAQTTASTMNNFDYFAAPPKGPEGTVDVVVTNPDGGIATLAGGFTYTVVTLTPSATVIGAGRTLTVTWSASGVRSNYDWIAINPIDGPNSDSDPGVWKYTAGGTSGTLTFNAPAVPGQYTFRYLPDDGYDDVARSVPITVIP